MASDFKRNWRSCASPSSRTVYANPELIERDEQDNVKTLLQALGSEDEGPPSLPTWGHDPKSAPPRSIPKLLQNASLHPKMRQMAQKEVERIYVSRREASISEVAEVAISDAFQVEIESAKDGVKVASFHFAKRIIVKLTQTGVLEKKVRSRYEVLDPVRIAYRCIRQTCVSFYPDFPPCGKLYPQKPEESVWKYC